MKRSTFDRVEWFRQKYPTDSSRAIAKRARVSHVTVCEIVKRSTYRPKTVIGIDGKERTASNRKTLAQSERRKAITAHVSNLEKLLAYWSDESTATRAFLRQMRQRLEQAFQTRLST